MEARNVLQYLCINFRKFQICFCKCDEAKKDHDIYTFHFRAICTQRYWYNCTYLLVLVLFPMFSCFCLVQYVFLLPKTEAELYPTVHLSVCPSFQIMSQPQTCYCVWGFSQTSNKIITMRYATHNLRSFFGVKDHTLVQKIILWGKKKYLWVHISLTVVVCLFLLILIQYW